MCLFPSRAQTQEFGKPKLHHEGDLLLPCGSCTECISKRAIEWATRAKHELSIHAESSFITLTYNNENLPSIHDIKPEFQKFIKRLRKKIKQPIRYMVSHEYGSKNFRPHHHAIIFGWNPNQQKLHTYSPKSGEPLFRSPELEALWDFGFSSIGTANERTAYYIASYSLKGKKHTLTDPHTGELITISDCMDASKRPAIGYNYFIKNIKQLIDSDQILPRYYLKRLMLENPTLHQQYENDRSLNLKSRSSQELLSKYIISQSNPISSQFRETDKTFTETTQEINQLTFNRDGYHRKTNKE